MDLFLILLSADFLKAAIRAATPLIGAATGEVISERGGFVNIGLEGIMLLGAFSGVVGSWWMQNVWVGVLVAILVGGLAGLFLAVTSLLLGANQIVTGTALNLAAAGITTFLNREIFGKAPPPVPSFSELSIPGLDRLPILGSSLFDHIPLVYVIYFIAPLCGLFLFFTNRGLRLRAIGEKPRAAQSAGVPVRLYQILALIFGGMMAGLAGTYYSLGNVKFFTDNMTVGNGFIALAVVIVSRWNPFFVVPVSLLFGAANALALRAQAFHVPLPYEFLFMVPYLLTLLVYAGVIGRSRMPASLGADYTPE
jgi:ABC-type uncharacterized transport system permease subunit